MLVWVCSVSVYTSVLRETWVYFNLSPIVMNVLHVTRGVNISCHVSRHLDTTGAQLVASDLLQSK